MIKLYNKLKKEILSQITTEIIVCDWDDFIR